MAVLKRVPMQYKEEWDDVILIGISEARSGSIRIIQQTAKELLAEDEANHLLGFNQRNVKANGGYIR